MSPVENLREFVIERLTAAAEEIFGVLKEAIVEYEEEIDRQRRLLEVVWKPEVKLHRIELLQQHDCKEEQEVLCNQERSSSLDQEQPEPPQIKEEEEELCSSQEGEQLVLKQETDTFMLTPIDEENDHSEDQTLDLNPDETLEEPLVNMPVINSVVSEANSDLQLLSDNSHVAESQDQKGGDHEDSGSPGDEEGKLNKTKQSKRKRHSDNVYKSTKSKNHCSPHTGEKSFTCDICGKNFKFKSLLERHIRSHTGERPYSCSSCEKRFSSRSSMQIHFRIHTGEKPYVCNTCGKDFRQSCSFLTHMRKVHAGVKQNYTPSKRRSLTKNVENCTVSETLTGEVSFKCDTCGKDFRSKSNFKTHMRIHTGEKPFSCATCGRAFRYMDQLTIHERRAHTGERPFLCNTCGKGFTNSSELRRHVRQHTGEKPFTCTTCGRAFMYSYHLTDHMRRIHTGEKPHICKLCGKRFFNTSDLARHGGTHSKDVS